MSMQTIILNFSGIYTQEAFINNSNTRIIDCTAIAGTNCYCDNDAVDDITQIIKPEPLNAIHFIDSGNYHYISKLWTDKIDCAFNLLVFDHHNDMQQPMFGDILSCGGWILKTIEENPYLNKVILIGVRDDLAEQIPYTQNKTICIKESDLPNLNRILNKLTPIFRSCPLYISIDKDAFSDAECITNWDQGSLTLSQLEEILNLLKSSTTILGIDICGETDKEQTSTRSVALNNRFNENIKKLFKKNGSQ